MAKGQRPVILIGAGGHARVLLEILALTGREVVGCLTLDGQPRNGRKVGIPVLGSDDALDRMVSEGMEIVNGIGSVGDPTRRIRIFERVKGLGGDLVTLVHPSAIIAADVTLGEGAQIMAGAVIQTGCRIGMNTIVNTGAIVDHDCRIGDHVHLAPGVVLSGEVRVEERSHLGTGVTVIQGIVIGAAATIGAGAVVVNDIPPNVRAIGVPARVVKE